MNNKRRNLVFLCLFIFVGIWNFISSADISFTTYHYESTLDDYRCVPNETAFETDNVFDPVRCGKMCYLGNMCRSIFYQPDSYKCIGCRINSPIPTCLHEPYPGSKYFRSQPINTKQEDNLDYASASDCKGILENRCDTASGEHKISLWMSKKTTTVICDMETDGGGWTVFQNRFDGSTDFYRNFSDYENGFVDLSGEFWLGLQILQEMTSQGKTELRLDLTAADDTTAYETFQNFYLGERPSYTLHIGQGTGTTGDESRPSLSQNAGGNFTTYDVDRDSEPSFNLAVETGSGWWHKFKYTDHSNLNGEYITPGTRGETGPADVAKSGMYYWKFNGWLSLKSTKMMFRRVNI